MTDEFQDRSESRLALSRERLEDLIEQRAQAARRRRWVVRRLVLMVLVAAGIGAASAVVTTHGILPSAGDLSVTARPGAEPPGARPSAPERTAPVGERTASVMMAESKRLRSEAPLSDRSRVVTARTRVPYTERVRRQKIQHEQSLVARAEPVSRTKRASTCERLQQELAGCTGSAATPRFGRPSSSSPVPSQAP